MHNVKNKVDQHYILALKNLLLDNLTYNNFLLKILDRKEINITIVKDPKISIFQNKKRNGELVEELKL